MDLTRIATEEDLEEALSTPYPEDIELARRLDGDVLVLGAGGKMGPTLVRRIAEAIRQAASGHRVFAVSRFTDSAQRRKVEAAGAAAISTDLFDDRALEALPSCANVIYMAGMKFGSTGSPSLTWAMNAYLPGRVAERFKSSRIAAFSTGNVYPLVSVESSGSSETDAPGPIGEYAQSCLGRERVLEHFSRRIATRLCILRLNYAVEARYGVLLDIGTKVWKLEPVPLGTSHANVIWQGDANSAAFRSLELATSPPRILNVAGPEKLSVREIAGAFAQRFSRAALFEGSELGSALLSDGSLARKLLGPPRVSAGEVIDLVARWIASGGSTLGKPTKFEVRDGRF